MAAEAEKEKAAETSEMGDEIAKLAPDRSRRTDEQSRMRKEKKIGRDRPFFVFPLWRFVPLRPKA